MFNFFTLSSIGGDWFLCKDIVLAEVGAGGGGVVDPVQRSSTLEHRGIPGGGSVGGGKLCPAKIAVGNPTDWICRGGIGGGGSGTQSSEPEEPDLEWVPVEEDVEACEWMPESQRLSVGVTDEAGEAQSCCTKVASYSRC